MSETEQEPREKYRWVFEELQATYGRPEWREHLPPVDELVSTILSQSTSDTNRDRGFQALKERFADWEELLDAPEEAIIEAIRPAGLANQKGPRIKGAMLFILKEQGELSLDFLDDMPVEEARSWLMQIKGVGIKTASIILLFSFGKPAFPVDTHVHRVSRRLGLIGQKVSAQKAHHLLEELGYPGTYYPMHLNMIRHGREICRAQRPLCEQCPLRPVCRYYAEKNE